MAASHSGSDPFFTEMYVMTVIMSTTFAPWVALGNNARLSAADYVAGFGSIAAVSFAPQPGQITATHSRRYRILAFGVLHRDIRMDLGLSDGGYSVRVRNRASRQAASRVSAWPRRPR
jgi:hypothetical protein